jgi:hypothetical protein
MKKLLIFLLAACSALVFAEDEMGFVPLFNGHDLAGWHPVNVAPGTFFVRDGMIVTTGVPLGVMRSDRMYENFIIELDWMHMKVGGNSGLYVFSDALPARGHPFTRALEIQIIDGNHPEGLWTGDGDVFAIQGATFVPDRPHPKGWMRCLPSEKRAHPAGQWNHYRVEARDGVVHLAVNGKVVSGGSRCVPRKGYLCLESEGSECHFKNFRIKELPSSTPPPNEVAEADQGFTTLYTGIDLAGWQQSDSIKYHWAPKDWNIVCDGKGTGENALRTSKEYLDYQMILDWRVAPPASGKKGKAAAGRPEPTGRSAVFVRGDSAARIPLTADTKSGEWNRLTVTVRGGDVTAAINGKEFPWNPTALPPHGPVAIEAAEPLELANVFLKTLNPWEGPRP